MDKGINTVIIQLGKNQSFIWKMKKKPRMLSNCIPQYLSLRRPGGGRPHHTTPHRTVTKRRSSACRITASTGSKKINYKDHQEDIESGTRRPSRLSSRRCLDTDTKRNASKRSIPMSPRHVVGNDLSTTSTSRYYFFG